MIGQQTIGCYRKLMFCSFSEQFEQFDCRVKAFVHSLALLKSLQEQLKQLT